VVATSGTALTLDQLKILSRYAGEITFCFDADNAGQTAMKRAIRMALQNDISIKIITTGEFKDPDEAIKDDPKNWERAVRNARPALEYWVDSLIPEGKFLDVSDKKMIAKEILPVIKIIFSDIEKEHYIKYLADKIAISEKSLIEALEKAKKDTEFTKPDSQRDYKNSHENLSISERILGLLWADPDLLDKVPKEILDSEPNVKHLPLLEEARSGNIDRDKIKNEFKLIYDQLSIQALANLDASKGGAIEEELLYLIGRQRSEQKEHIKKEFAKKIKEAEARNDKEGLKKLLAEFSTLIK
jgi:DNA primase